MYPKDYIPDFRSDCYLDRGYVDSPKGYQSLSGVAQASVPYGLAGVLAAAVVVVGL